MPSLRIVKNDATNMSKGMTENTNGFNLFITAIGIDLCSLLNIFIGPRVENIYVIVR